MIGFHLPSNSTNLQRFQTKHLKIDTQLPKGTEAMDPHMPPISAIIALLTRRVTTLMGVKHFVFVGKGTPLMKGEDKRPTVAGLK